MKTKKNISARRTAPRALSPTYYAAPYYAVMTDNLLTGRNRHLKCYKRLVACRTAHDALRAAAKASRFKGVCGFSDIHVTRRYPFFEASPDRYLVCVRSFDRSAKTLAGGIVYQNY